MLSLSPSPVTDYPGPPRFSQSNSRLLSGPQGYENRGAATGSPISNHKSVSFRPNSGVETNSFSPSSPGSRAPYQSQLSNSSNPAFHGFNGGFPAQSDAETPGGASGGGNTPGVIGAQEVYRDPRQRIEAQQRSQKARAEAADRLSFKDKMQMFATEAGESTPVQRPKASKSQRVLEDALSYGSGRL